MTRAGEHKLIPTDQTLFAVPMTCESCVKDISTTLYKLEGISNVKVDLKDQLVSIEGTGSYYGNH